MCLYPTLIKNPKYKSTKKNGGNIPPIRDERVKYVPIGCQQCMECRKQKARGWQLRLLEDIKKHKDAKFLTLTFSNQSIKQLICDEKIKHLDGYELDNELATRAVRLFLERWRKKYKKSLRHWLVTEIGHNGTENIHLHGIVYGAELKEVENIWKYGYVWKGREKNGRLTNYVNAQTVNYIVKYITKQDEKHKGFKSKVLTSPGIGANYMENNNRHKNKYNGADTVETYRTADGRKIAMPTYWRNKIYSEEEREKLWLHKLDKQERWVAGERISIKDGEAEYYKTLDWYRKINKQLGYGDGSKNWNREQYEKERRALMIKKRIENCGE